MWPTIGFRLTYAAPKPLPPAPGYAQRLTCACGGGQAQVLEFRVQFGPYDISSSCDIDNFFFSTSEDGGRRVGREAIDAIVPSLLPRTGGWLLREGKGQHRGLSVISSSRAGQSECILHVHVVRDFTLFAIKRIVPGFLVVFAGLLALFLDPQAAPLVGGRCSLIILGMLVAANMMRWPTEVAAAVKRLTWPESAREGTSTHRLITFGAPSNAPALLTRTGAAPERLPARPTPTSSVTSETAASRLVGIGTPASRARTASRRSSSS